MKRSELLRPRTPKQWLIYYKVMFWATSALTCFFTGGALWLAFSIRNAVGAVGFSIIAAVEFFVARVLLQRARAARQSFQDSEA